MTRSRQSSAIAGSKPRKRGVLTVHDRNLLHQPAQDRGKKLRGTLLRPGKAVEAGAAAQAGAVQGQAKAAESEAGGKNENQRRSEII
jgi:hypothetical protein